MIPTIRSDQELYELLVRDPDRGLAAVMDQYTGLVYTIVQGKLASVGTRQDVEECVGDVFVELWRTRESLDPMKGSLRAYLAVLSRRRAIDTYRRLCTRERRLPTDECPFDEQKELIDDSDPAREIVAREAADELIRAVKALGEPDSEIIIRKYYLGQSAKEIGKALKMKENTVNKRATRALVRLKEIMGGVSS